MTGSIEKLQSQYGIEVKWRAFPLHPDTPEQGLSLEALFAKKGIFTDVDKIVAQLKATAAKFNLPMGDRKMTYNSRLAQEVGMWAEEKGKGHAFHMAAFKAYFVDGHNLAEKQVLLALIRSVALDPVEGENIIDQRVFKDAVNADWEMSRAKKITAVPTFIMGLDRLVGAQSHEVLEKMFIKYGYRQNPL
ncbi:MAG: DsbA family protein [Proteobacteria bacterium]|nr:DsbA family protein [Pseudomonadota bacterium]